MQRRIAKEILRLIDARIPFAVATVISAQGSVPGKAGARMIVYPDGGQLGTVGGAGVEQEVKQRCLECIEHKRSGLFPFNLWNKSPGGLDSICGGKVEVHVEYVAPSPHLLLCGGGHVGYEVARLCDQLEYEYSVLDERAEFASPERFPRARQLYPGEQVEQFPLSALAGFSHIIIAGHSHQIDLTLLKRVAAAFEGFIGVIGSAKKKQQFFAALSEHGIPPERLARIECPIGLPIGAVTPSEIAVSILASVISTVRASENAD